MNERYIATSRSGERVIRTDSAEAAREYQAILGGRIIDMQAQGDHS